MVEAKRLPQTEADKFANQLLEQLVNSPTFGSMRPCVFLSKKYQVDWTIMKISILKHFYCISLTHVILELHQINREPKWLIEIKATLSEAFDNYKVANHLDNIDEEGLFDTFTEDEKEFVVFSTLYLMTILKVPAKEINIVLETLVESGIKNSIVKNICIELEHLNS